MASNSKPPTVGGHIRRRCAWLALVAVAGSASACGTSGQTAAVDAGLDAPAGTHDGPDAPTGDGGSSETGPAAMGKRLLLSGSTTLVGNDACSRPSSPARDRWCAFVQFLFPQQPQLWVINISQAIAGVDIRCDGMDKNCRRLSIDLVGAEVSGNFNGETLVFVGNTRSPSPGAWAWRPDWPAPRLLASSDYVFCMTSPTGASALCLTNFATAVGVATVDLRAGTLTGPEGPPLPKLDQIIVSVEGDPASFLGWGAMFSPDGSALAWSTRSTPDGKEALKAQNLSDPMSQRTVADDVAAFRISRDGTRYYWLKQFSYGASGDESGILQAAPFPEGTGATTLVEDVGEFVEAGSKGLIVRTGIRGGAGALKVIPDRDQPAVIAALDTGVTKLWPPARDGLAAAYSKTFSQPTASDLYLSSSQTAAPCVLVAGNASLRGVMLSDRGTQVAWGERNQADTGFDGFFASATDCVARQFASALLRFDPIGEEGYVWQADAGERKGGTIRYGRFVNDELAKGGIVVDTGVLDYAILREQAAILYTVNFTGTLDGLYLSTGLPFSTGP